MFKTRLIALALLGAGAVGITAAPASALTVAPQPAAQQGEANPNLIEVNNHRRDRDRNRNVRRDNDRRYDFRRHGPRCSRYSNNCRHFYRGYYYASPWWTLPFVGAGIVVGNNYAVRGYSSRHVEWCLDRYRSYNVRTNTWVSYSGEIRQCRSPYR